MFYIKTFNFFQNFCIPLNSQIKDDEDPDTVLVYEFLPDFHGGYKRESKPTVIKKWMFYTALRSQSLKNWEET